MALGGWEGNFDWQTFANEEKARQKEQQDAFKSYHSSLPQYENTAAQSQAPKSGAYDAYMYQQANGRNKLDPLGHIQTAPLLTDPRTFDANGYDPVSGTNRGDLGFRTGGGTRIYSDPNLDFQTAYGGYGGGYVNFYKDPSKLNDYGTGSDRWSAVRSDPLKIVYENYRQQMPTGSNQIIGNQEWASSPTINGIDYSSGQSYAELAKHGIGTPRSGKRASDFGQSGPLGQDSVIPYTPTTEPGYRPPTYSQTSVGQREDSSTPFTGFGFGQQGQPGYKFMSGQFSSQTPGTSSQFFSQQPESINPAPNPLLGIFKPVPDASLKALQKFRSQP